MSFSFAAIGTRAEVIAQLRSHHAPGDHQLAAATRQLVADALDSDISQELGSYGYSYLVKAQGHAGSPASLTLTIEPVWVPRLAPEVVDVGEFVASEAAQEAAEL